jgi:hypothetical protein
VGCCVLIAAAAPSIQVLVVAATGAAAVQVQLTITNPSATITAALLVLAVPIVVIVVIVDLAVGMVSIEGLVELLAFEGFLGGLRGGTRDVFLAVVQGLVLLGCRSRAYSP